MFLLAPTFLFLAGSAVGAAMYRRHSLKYRYRVQRDADAVVNEGQTLAADLAHSSSIERHQWASNQSVKVSQSFNDELESIQNFKGEIVDREARQDRRSLHIEAGFKAIDTAQQNNKVIRREAQEKFTQAKNLMETRIKVLETRSEVLSQEIHSELVGAAVDVVSLRTQRQHRLQAEEIQKEGQVKARKLLTTAMDRYNGIGHLERLQNNILIPNQQTFDAWQDTSGKAHQTLTEEIPFELYSDPGTQHLLVRGDNPLAREIARRAIRQIANRSVTNPQKIRSIAKQCTSEVNREVENAGQKAIRTLRIGQVHPEIQELVGRLKFRLSYSQNQLKHAIEVGYLAGIMAEELGLDVHSARRGGLLHDIGKAMTHEHEGSHAVLGAEVARRCGETELVANAIGAHHNDEPMASPIAHIVTAADAISGARPGARRETVTLYLERVQQIQEIAKRAEGIERVDVMNGGREVRITVNSQDQGDVEDNIRNSRTLNDSDLHPLAEEVARALEEEVIFPGQIRVTVIRESRSVSTAR